MRQAGEPGDRDEVSELMKGKLRSRRALLWLLVGIAAFVVARQAGLFGPVIDSQSLATADSAAILEELRAAGPLLGEGNPAGDRILIEFFDYRCGHCRRMAPVLQDLVAEDPNLHLILVDFPVLGPESVLAAQFALAASLQDAYDVYHRALMYSPVEWTAEALTDLGESLGLDGEKLRQDAESAEISTRLAANKAIGGKAGIDGTPAFVTGDFLIVGAVDAVTLQEMIRQAGEATTGGE
jgi:protein-disulfide isomerase